jgi:hypothetical protein
MKFASVRQIVALTALWWAALLVIDYFKNPHLWGPAPVSLVADQEGVQVGLWFNHLCCTGCLADVREAVAALPGLGAPTVMGKELVTRAQADAPSAAAYEYGNMVRISVNDLDQLDFVALEDALRAKGFIAARMELGGIPHFRLEADVGHLCCGMCTKATHEDIAFVKARGLGGQLKWLDSMTVDNVRKKVVVYARYLEPGRTVNVAELILGLNHVGWAPRSLHVRVGERRAESSSPSLRLPAGWALLAAASGAPSGVIPEARER